jgi:hypothetical protein
MGRIREIFAENMKIFVNKFSFLESYPKNQLGSLARRGVQADRRRRRTSCCEQS